MKLDLTFDPPIMNAAGALGFAPDLHSAPDRPGLGAFLTNPISAGPRRPAQGVRYLSFAGGFLLHTGFPNPGIRAATKHFASTWKRSPIPVYVHLLCQNPAQLRKMVAHLEASGAVSGIELGISPRISPSAALQFIQQAVGELPVIVRLPLERATELAYGIVSLIDANGRQPDQAKLVPAAFSLGPPRGALPLAGQGLLRGRLYGPALFPLALAALQALRPLGIPLIGAGGVYQDWQIEAMLGAGALAVQLDSVFWRGSWAATATQ